ncbi:MAG: protein GumC [Desulfobacteraceae bacterium]|nr:protein GumC [Desulfobacteraceae bacterium]
MADGPNIQTALTPDQIIDIIIRRRWIVLIPLCISLSAGIYLAFTLPRTYKASTSILVHAQTVPGSYVKSIVSSGINNRISTISQQVMSRSNLEKIIDQFALFEDEKSAGMYLEDKVAVMRKRINVKLTRARNGTDAFSISYKGKDPAKVMKITNTLSSYFMDENLKLREAQAVGTSEFLDAELEKTRKRLVEREKKLSEYRAKFLGGLPDELESNLRTLDRLQQQLSDKQATLRDAKNAVNALNAQIFQLKEMAQRGGEGQPVSLDSMDDGFEGTENEVELKQAKKMLEALLLRYTSQHPDVKKLQATIEKLQVKVDEEASVFEEARTSEPGKKTKTPVLKKSRTLQQLEMQVDLIKTEINSLNADIKANRESTAIYQKRVEDTPKREQDLLSLKRDYGNIKDVFNSLLDRKLEAELAVNMEKKQKGEQFRILDHARVPQKPISPDIKKLIIFSLAAGMGVAGGIIFLLEIFNASSIRWDEDIETKLGLPILASIPPLKKAGDGLKKKIEMVLFLATASYVAGVLCLFVVINQKGIGRVVNFIKLHLT